MRGQSGLGYELKPEGLADLFLPDLSFAPQGRNRFARWNPDCLFDTGTLSASDIFGELVTDVDDLASIVGIVWVETEYPDRSTEGSPVRLEAADVAGFALEAMDTSSTFDGSVKRPDPDVGDEAYSF